MNTLELAIWRARTCKAEAHPARLEIQAESREVDPPLVKESILDKNIRERVIILTARVAFLESVIGRICSEFSISAQPHRETRISVHNVLRVVADHYGVLPTDITGISRKTALIRPRHVAMYLAKQLTDLPFAEVGRHIGRDHTTVLHGIRQITTALPADEKLREDVEYLTELLSPTTGEMA